MPRKEYSLFFQDIFFYITGNADVSIADFRKDSWIYPADWGYQISRDSVYFSPKDARGVPIRDYPGSLGEQYLYSRIAGYALGHWNRFTLEGDDDSRGRFLNIADWLSDNKTGRYEHDFPVAEMQLPWISCISQGEIASVLARACHLTGEARFADAAERAAHWLARPVADGGVLDHLPDGQPFLEEYPGSKYRHVLNGCLYAVVGLHDTIRVCSNNEDHMTLFRALIAALEANLQHWDVDGWSVYDFGGNGSQANLNTMTYQILQTALLSYLAHVSGSATLQAYSDRWQRSARSLPRRLSAMQRKFSYRLSQGW